MPAIPKFKFGRRFQTKLVRAMFQYPEEARDILTFLDPGMFDTAPMKWSVRKMQQAFKQHNIPATDTMLEFEATQDVAIGLIKAEYIDAYATFIDRLGRRKVPDKSYLLDKAHDYVRYIQSRDFVLDFADQLQNPDTMDWIKINKALDKQRTFAERSGGDLGQDYFGDTTERMERRKHIEKNGIPTGTVLDEYMRAGGPTPKQLCAVVAPAGVGKTTFLVYITGTAVAAGRNALYVSLELEEDIIGEKFDARFSGVSLMGLEKREGKVKSKIKAVHQRYGGELRIKYFDSGTLTMAGLRSYLKRLEADAFYPEMIVVDYLDIMSLDEYGGNAENEHGPLGRLYVDVRGLMGERHAVGWTASHSNRESYGGDSPIKLNNLSGSLKKGAHADVMATLEQNDDELLQHIARFRIIKNRNGPTGAERTVKFSTRHVRISDV